MGKRIFIKGFDKNLQCRGYQFKIGKEYKIDLPKGYTLTENDLCSNRYSISVTAYQKYTVIIRVRKKQTDFALSKYWGSFAKKRINAEATI